LWDAIIAERLPIRMAAVAKATTMMVTICFMLFPPLYVKIKPKKA
jgi:hypothetical protein